MLRIFQGNPLRGAKIISIALIFAVVVYADLVYRVAVSTPLIPEFIQISERALDVIFWALAALSLAQFAVGAWLFGYSLRHAKLRRGNSPLEMRALSLSVLRSSYFEVPALYGLILGMLGIDWRVPVAFFASSVLALILTFSTQKRWQSYIAAVGI